MVYQEDLVKLDEEWRRVMIAGDESANALIQIPGEIERRKNQLLSYGRKLADSVIGCSEKEARMKQLNENLRYLENKKTAAAAESGNQLLEGMIIGGLATFIGMYLMDRMGEYMKDEMSKGMIEGLYSELGSKGFKQDLMK
jgi:hypothetical protein